MFNITSSISDYLKLNKYTGVTITAILFIYLIIRAINIPFLHDEIMTYWYYVDTARFLPFCYNPNIDGANNHILNTLITFIASKFLGNSPFILRISNLLFIPLYCFYAYKISNILKNKGFALIFWLCLLLIHPIIEFLALCRGYGISFTLLLGSIWYLILTFRKNSIKNYFLSSILITFSISANLSLMNTAILINCILIMHLLLSKDNYKNKTLKLLTIFISGFVPVYFWALYSFELKKAGALYYGTQDGFWTQSVISICKAIFKTDNQIVLYAIFLYFSIILILSLIYFSKNLKILSKYTVLIFPILLTGNIVAVLLLAKIFNVNYPEDRSGFHFYYLFIGSIFFSIDKFSEKFEYRKLIWFLSPFLLIPIQFFSQINISHISVYKEDRIPSHFYKTIVQKTQNDIEIPTIGSYFGRTLVFAFHNYLNNGNIPKIHDTDYPSLTTDYLLLNPKDFQVAFMYYHSIDSDCVTGYHLLERNEKLKRSLIAKYEGISSKTLINNEFFNLVEGKIDSLIEKTLFFEYNLDIVSDTKPFEAWIVVSVSDSAGNQKAYEYIPLNWYKREWNNKNKHFHNGQLITNLPITAYKYVTYIWNINKVNFRIEKGSLSIKSLGN